MKIKKLDKVNISEVLSKQEIMIKNRIWDLKAEIYKYEKVLKLIKYYNH